MRRATFNAKQARLKSGTTVNDGYTVEGFTVSNPTIAGVHAGFDFRNPQYACPGMGIVGDYCNAGSYIGIFQNPFQFTMNGVMFYLETRAPQTFFLIQGNRPQIKFIGFQFKLADSTVVDTLLGNPAIVISVASSPTYINSNYFGFGNGSAVRKGSQETVYLTNNRKSSGVLTNGTGSANLVYLGPNSPSA